MKYELVFDQENDTVILSGIYSDSALVYLFRDGFGTFVVLVSDKKKGSLDFKFADLYISQSDSNELVPLDIISYKCIFSTSEHTFETNKGDFVFGVSGDKYTFAGKKFNSVSRVKFDF